MNIDFPQLAERKMLAALAEGKLSHLPGEGLPLPDRIDNIYIDPFEAMAFRLLHEAGLVPKEVELNKQRMAARKAWQEAPEDQRDALMGRIAELDMRYNITHEARLHLLHHR